MRKLIIYTDGGARGNPGPAGIGVVIQDDAKRLIARHGRYIGEATNNVAEYQALLLALQKAAKLKAQELLVHMDSELVVRQMQGVYKIKEPALKDLALEAFRLIKKFSRVSFRHVMREQNKEADRLVNQAIDQKLSS